MYEEGYSEILHKYLSFLNGRSAGPDHPSLCQPEDKKDERYAGIPQGTQACGKSLVYRAERIARNNI